MLCIFTIASNNSHNYKYTMVETASLNRINAVLADEQKTSKWLAERLGKSETTVSRWASNKIQPSLDQLFEIANVLDIDVKDLIKPSKE